MANNVARMLVGRFLNGVFYVHLAEIPAYDAGIIGTPFRIALAIAEAINLTINDDENPIDTLFAYLQQREMLLLLDNFEHLLSATDRDDDGAAFVVRLLKTAPDVKLLISSRERLNLRAEKLLRLSGLPYPDQKTATLAVDEELAAYDAIQLLLIRVPEEKVAGHRSLQALARIAALVEGSPLALELAASWLHAQSAAEVAKLLAENISTLAATYRDMPARHRSLRAVFEHSWKLLNPRQQATFARLAVFHGAFSGEAAKNAAQVERGDLPALLDKSLIRQVKGATSSLYTLHAMLHQFAAEKLSEQPGAFSKSQTRHAAHYCELMAQLDSRWQNKWQTESVQIIKAELDNIRAAWDWVVEMEEMLVLSNVEMPALAASLTSLYYFYWATGRHIEGHLNFGAGVKAAQKSGDDILTARLQAKQAEFAYLLGHTAEAETLLKESIPILRQTDLAEDLAEALGCRCRLHYAQGDFTEALSANRECLMLYHHAENGQGIALGLNMQATILCDAQADYDQAHKLYKESLAISREIEDKHGIARALINLGANAEAQQYYAQAETLIVESLELYRETEYVHGIGTALGMLGSIAATNGNFDEAIEFLEQSIDLACETNDRFKLVAGQRQLGETYLKMGEFPAARRQLVAALRQAQALGAADQLIHVLLSFVKLFAIGDEREMAGVLLWYLGRQNAGQATKEKIALVTANYPNLGEPDLTTQKRWQILKLAEAGTKTLHFLTLGGI